MKCPKCGKYLTLQRSFDNYPSTDCFYEYFECMSCRETFDLEEIENGRKGM